MKRMKKLLSAILTCAVLAAGFSPAALAAEPDREGWTAVSSAEELAAINNDLSGKYYLTDNIDLTGTSWTPIGTANYKLFTGKFDGGGHVIKGLTVKLNYGTQRNVRYGAGLFGFTSGAEIKNVSVIDASVSNEGKADASVGILVGCALTTTIVNCYTSGEAVNNCTYGAGGIVGSTFGTGSSSGTDGGAYILRCASSADVSSTVSMVGGIVGNTCVPVEECYFTGDVSSSSSCAGGIAGRTTSTVRYCWSSGSVAGKQNGANGGVAGLVGSGSASTSYTVADVNALNTFNTTNINYRSAQPAVGGGSARDVYFEKGHFSVKGASNDSWDGYTGSYLNGTARSEDEMLTADTYEGWTDTVNPRTGETMWDVEDGKYPQLRHTGPIPTDFPDEAETWTVSFRDGARDGDTVTGMPGSREAEDGESIRLPDAPIRTNGLNWVYDFMGWSDGADTYDEEELYTVNGDVTFTAAWKLHSVNGDGEWTYLDAMIIMDHLAGNVTLTDEQLAVADRNGDGMVSYLDAMYIMDVLAGTIVE